MIRYVYYHYQLSILKNELGILKTLHNIQKEFKQKHAQTFLSAENE